MPEKITVNLFTSEQVNSRNDWAKNNTSWSDNEIILHEAFSSLISNLLDKGYTLNEIKFAFNESAADYR